MTGDRARKAPDLADMLAGDAASSPGEERPAFVHFERCGREFVVDAALVEAIVRVPAITPLPYPAAGVAGVAPVRGRIRIVVCVAGEPAVEAARLVVLNGEDQLALAADRVVGVRGDSGAGEMVDPDALVT